VKKAHPDRQKPRIERPPISVYGRMPVVAKVGAGHIQVSQAVGSHRQMAARKRAACPDQQHNRLAGSLNAQWSSFGQSVMGSHRLLAYVAAPTLQLGEAAQGLILP
jgi:hypothetical protein